MERRKLKTSIRATHHRQEGDALTAEEQELQETFIAQGMDPEQAKHQVLRNRTVRLKEKLIAAGETVEVLARCGREGDQEVLYVEDPHGRRGFTTEDNTLPA